MTAADTVLNVSHLSLSSSVQKNLVSDVSFSIAPGECLGLVGESGSGKTITLRSILGILPPGIVLTGGSIEKHGSCAMIFQNPVSALDPLCPVVSQLVEVIRCHQKMSRESALVQADELLRMLDLPVSLERLDRYPGQLSGGQCQRIMIAIALACRPDLLLCDEPTTALDVTVQKQIIAVLRNLQHTLEFSMLFVTHNLAVASALCTSLCVMKQGTVVEKGDTKSVLSRPQTEYTKLLIRSVLPVPECGKEE